MSKNYRPDARYYRQTESLSEAESDARYRTEAQVDTQIDERTRTPVDIAGTTYTISISDVNQWLRFTSASAVTVTWPDALSLPAGSQIDFWRAGTADITVEAETPADTTFNGLDSFVLQAQYSHVKLTVVSDSVMDCLPTGTVSFV